MARFDDDTTCYKKLTVIGEFTPAGGLPDGTVGRDELIEDELAVHVIPLTEMLVTGTGARLGTSAGTPAGAFGLTVGVHGTNTPVVVGETAWYNSKTNKMRCFVPLRPEYVAQGSIQIRIRAKVGATMAVSQTLDVTCRVADRDGGVTADICATTIKTLTTAYADYTFTLTTSGRAVGELLDIEITGVCDDTGGSANEIMSIAEVAVLADIKG